MSNLVSDLAIALDVARAMVNQLHQELEAKLKAAEGLPEEEDSKATQASTLVALAEGADLWHTPDGDAYATVEIAGHRETWGLSAKAFRSWLSFLFYQAEAKAPGIQAIYGAISVLRGKALFEGEERVVFTRVAEVGAVIYLDLANSSWEAVEISADGWSVVADFPVKFRRSRGMLALPYPISGGGLAALHDLLNLASDDDWALFLGCLVQALRGGGHYPILAFAGEHGSAKSTASKVFRRILDPNQSDLRSPPRDERDLRIQAMNGWVVAYDNLSSIPEWLSNALCRISTGGGMGTRELYSDDEEKIFEGQRPIVLNGIEDVVVRPDLVDRAVLVTLKSIDKDRRRTEKEFWASFDAAHSAILGGLLDAVVVGLRNADSTYLEGLPRMADFALWVTSTEPGLGLQPGAFMRAYEGNRATANDTALEAAVIAPYLLQLMEDREEWSGTVTELLAELDVLVPDNVRKQKGWPTRANILSGKLRTIAPNLREAGIEVVTGRERGKRKLTLVKNKVEEPSSTSSSVHNAAPSDAPHIQDPTPGQGDGVDDGVDDVDDENDETPRYSKTPWGPCDCPTPEHFGPGDPQPECSICRRRLWCAGCGGCVSCKLAGGPKP